MSEQSIPFSHLLFSDAVANGSALADLIDHNLVMVQVSGISVAATVQMSQSVDGTTYYDVGAQFAADGVLEITPFAARYLKATIAAWAAGDLVTVLLVAKSTKS